MVAVLVKLIAENLALPLPFSRIPIVDGPDRRVAEASTASARFDQSRARSRAYPVQDVAVVRGVDDLGAVG
jgi:hypothetical protein